MSDIALFCVCATFLLLALTVCCDEGDTEEECRHREEVLLARRRLLLYPHCLDNAEVLEFYTSPSSLHGHMGTHSSSTQGATRRRAQSARRAQRS